MPCRDASGDDAAGVELIYILNRQAKRLFGSSRFLLKGTERVQHGRTAVPRHLIAPVGNIISKLGADRNDLLWNRLELPQELPIFLFDPVEHVLPVARSILFTTTANWRTPRSDKRYPCFLDCSFTPSNASISNNAP